MADKTFQVDVVSPDQVLYSGSATFLRAQTTDGEVGILASHAPIFAELAPGGAVVVTEADGSKVAIAAQGGFLSVTGTEAKVLAESAQLAREVDVEAERAVLESAEEGTEEYLAARSRIRAVDALS
ncbi:MULTISPECIES: F0F1 ATP synthase subunit epsilon [unclassified Gordonia (in: high G+C Gram-positive bacteria)]|uniref:F0F1 ATP synthase subunit epsilon n=1 Tax=unclassified Gordonia (in: high G+C Gram-positive bacteria) TaxID=2657482 RepID=UPI001FFE75CD|nr:F0F1 ATP synthase subunit epsilon [Gordonia sp. PP30]UQE76345.1 F0F1 ATP synthase subunit epsilon [Gordonia sp. PP30]